MASHSLMIKRYLLETDFITFQTQLVLTAKTRCKVLFSHWPSPANINNYLAKPSRYLLDPIPTLDVLPLVSPSVVSSWMCRSNEQIFWVNKVNGITDFFLSRFSWAQPRACRPEVELPYRELCVVDLTSELKMTKQGVFFHSKIL